MNHSRAATVRERSCRCFHRHRFLTVAARVAFVAAVAAVSSPATSSASDLPPHPVAQQLITEGFAVADGDFEKLPPPVVQPTMSADEQRRALEQLVGKTRIRSFLRNSQVARHQLDVPTIRKLPDGSTVRGLNLAFVVYADLSAIGDQQFASGKKPSLYSNFETYFEPLEGRPDPESTDAIDWASSPRLYRYRLPLVDKVVAEGLLEGQSVVKEDIVLQTIVSPTEHLDHNRYPTVWRSIPRGAKGDDQLGPSLPFRGMAGYLQATPLHFQLGAVLVEAHLIYVEPKGWFGGRNLLASKLPLLLQDSVRKFRRELAKRITKES